MCNLPFANQLSDIYVWLPKKIVIFNSRNEFMPFITVKFYKLKPSCDFLHIVPEQHRCLTEIYNTPQTLK